VDLRKNRIGDVGVARLAEGMSDCLNLCQLELSNNQFSWDGSGCSARAEGMRACPSLQELILVDNVIGDTGMRGHPSLTNLDLNSCHIGNVGAAALAEGLRACIGLQELILGQNPIDEVGVAALSKGMRAHPSLAGAESEFEYWGCTCCGAGKRSSVLQVADVENSSISAVGVAALAEGIRTCPSLTLLKLSDAEFGDKGAVG
jgi:Leucine-rich repeat (LRR) protein